MLMCRAAMVTAKGLLKWAPRFPLDSPRQAWTDHLGKPSGLARGRSGLALHQRDRNSDSMAGEAMEGTYFCRESTSLFN